MLLENNGGPAGEAATPAGSFVVASGTEAVSDMHYVNGTIVDAATELVPGESVDELRTARAHSESSLRELVSSLYAASSVKRPISHDTLVKSEPTDDIGKIKRSTLVRLKDRFFMFWTLNYAMTRKG